MKSPIIQIFLISIACIILWIFNNIFSIRPWSNESAISILYLILLLYPFYRSFFIKAKWKIVPLFYVILIYSIACFSLIRMVFYKPDFPRSDLEKALCCEYPTTGGRKYVLVFDSKGDYCTTATVKYMPTDKEGKYSDVAKLEFSRYVLRIKRSTPVKVIASTKTEEGSIIINSNDVVNTINMKIKKGSE